MKRWAEIRNSSGTAIEQRAEDDAWVRAESERLAADDHPGGPLSRAERVVLSGLKNTAMRCRALISGMHHVIGAVPGAQKIESSHAEAVAALDRLLLAMKTRKQGAPTLATGTPPAEPGEARAVGHKGTD